MSTWLKPGVNRKRNLLLKIGNLLFLLCEMLGFLEIVNLPRSFNLSGSPQSLSRFGASVLAIFQDPHAVNEYVLHADS